MKIKELLERAQSRSELFIEDFRAMTDKRSYNDLETAKTRVYGGVVITVGAISDDTVSLSEIQSRSPQGGEGTRALRLLTSLADKHGVKIVGVAQKLNPKDKNAISAKDLIRWYTKNGFIAKGSNITYQG